MIRFLRRIFGRHGPSIYDNQHCDDGDYDTETYDMILSSIDLLEHLRNAGENVELERAVSHFFVGESCDIKRAGRMFRGLGFLIGVEEDNRLQIVERAILSDAWVARTIPFMHRTGGEFELDYNGWDCGRALDPTEELVII